ncbi:LOW QUALITY PROTEIN: prolyl 3-hydroxylase 3 [Rhinatrema bivittatum]|uniref:LOW QUALITY PROTEIN: prolyl 3-hydroxylase 3 n=1 Tax=Rhinatrema bivittatum TaxID=194408 RepID=UPI00112C0A68|nr:LOW QUALITY PROTEIN: prolyl 3-hydroxylase 3 [Rhinatrema bivittatum]
MASLPCWLLFLAPMLLSPGPCSSLAERSWLQPYDLLYNVGVHAFFQGDWSQSREYLQRALHSYSLLREVKVSCRAQCQTEAGFRPWQGDLGFMDSVLQRAECLEHCERLQLGPPSRHRVSRAVRREFQEREPYNFLQQFYFKLGQMDAALAAAHTFFVANPEHAQIREDLGKYRNVQGVRWDRIQDLEALPHWEAYEQGVAHYSLKNYTQAIVRLETSLKEALETLEECQALCEGRQEEERHTGVHQELYEVIAEWYIQVLKCRQSCVRDVATKPGQKSPVHDFIPSHFHLLHSAYAEVADGEAAIETILTYLLFYPRDNTAAAKLQQYRERFGEETRVQAREQLRLYIQRSLSEKALLFNAMESLDVSFEDPDSWTPEESVPQDIRERMRVEKQRRRKKEQEEEEKKAAADAQRGPLPFEGPTITLDSQQLNGTHRVVLDGVLTWSECQEILQLAGMPASSGEGFQRRRSPHTPHEHFQSLTVLKAVKLAGETPGVRLFFDAGERSQRIVGSYFRTEKPLHISFTQLVCRTAVKGKQEGRVDLSHPVHADNCILDPEGRECWKEPPAYVHRDYSGVLYLNDDFEGGDLFFTDLDASTVTAEVRPTCGRMAAFTSGAENPHGVRAVTSGRRCAIVLWFTHSPEYAEKERKEAEELLAEMEVLSPKDEEVMQGNTSPRPPALDETKNSPGRKERVLSTEHAQFTREEL